MTDRYAIIGHPVGHSRSPWIHAEFASACAQDMAYDRIEAPLEGFAAAVDAFRAGGGKGMNVTVPFKFEACRYAGRLSARAQKAQVANTLAFGAEVFGDSTDGVGLVRDLSDHLEFELKGRRVLLMGAGGAAQGVAGDLLAAGIGELVVANRTEARAKALVAGLPGSASCSYGALEGRAFDLVINATSAGLKDEAPGLPAGILRRGVLAYDMVYGRETPFLAAARAAGARACDGLGMLVEQAAESFFVWRAVRPATAPVLAKLRAA
jgi:shikimate dehydrogenase